MLLDLSVVSHPCILSLSLPLYAFLSPQKNLVFRLESAKERDEWVEALKKARATLEFQPEETNKEETKESKQHAKTDQK